MVPPGVTQSDAQERRSQKPVRVQLKRIKGWRMPPNTVKVDRSTKFGNPHDWRDWMDSAPRDVLWTRAEREVWAKEQAVEAYRADIRAGDIVVPVSDLLGLNLACWCAPYPRFACHADVLLELANSPPPGAARDIGARVASGQLRAEP